MSLVYQLWKSVAFCVLIRFFFFKQKTAYEIKECDWSSDVCSSDLGDAVLDQERIAKTQQRVHGVRGGAAHALGEAHVRSEERRVGKECRSRWSPYH